MDFMCLNRTQTTNLKQRCEVNRTQKKNMDSNFEYYHCDHFNMHGKTVKAQLLRDGATNAVFANLEP